MILGSCLCPSFAGHNCEAVRCCSRRLLFARFVRALTMHTLRPHRLNRVFQFCWLASVGVTCGCGGEARPAGEASQPVVRVARPVVRDVTEYAYFTGRTDAPQSVDLQARVTGYLDSVDFVSGSEVKAGQELFKIDPRPYQAALDSANGQVKLAEAQVNLAAADYARAVNIARTPGAISQQDIDKYAASEEEAKAQLDASKANSESARLNLEFTTIAAPIDGLIGRNYPTVGNLVRQDSTLMATVVSQDPMYAYFDVDEQTMLRVGRLIREGKIKSRLSGPAVPVQMALADEDNQYPREGQVDFINNRINPTTGTLEVRGVFSNPHIANGPERMLKPGMFVRIRVPIGDPYQALVVPQAAIGTDQGRKFLLVVDDKNVVEERVVALGPEQPEGMQVVTPIKMVRTGEGLLPADEAANSNAPTVDSIQAGDQIIVGGLQRVRPGATVKIREPENQAVAGEPIPASVAEPSTASSPSGKAD
jgi:membrane fusion protein, multidrug efflux system